MKLTHLTANCQICKKVGLTCRLLIPIRHFWQTRVNVCRIQIRYQPREDGKEMLFQDRIRTVTGL